MMPETALPETAESPRNTIALKVTLVALLGLGLLLLLSANTTLWDRDEPRFARAAVEMLGSGDYIVPTFNGDLRPDKPVFIYWLMVLGLRMFGVCELAVRCFSCLGVTAAGVLTFLIGRRLFDARVGLWAMIMLLSSIVTIYIGAAAMTDGVLLALITLAIFAFIEMARTGTRFWHIAVLAIALGLAQLTKGPVGLAIPLVTMISAAWLGRRHLTLGRRFWWGIGVAIILSIGMFVAWGIPANIRTDGRFFEQGIGRHVLHRIAAPMEGHGGSGLAYLAMLPMYVPFLILGFCPWTLQLSAAISALSGRRIGTPASRALLWAWIAPTFLMMSLFATKLPHYILPIFPPLAIASAATLQAWRRGELSSKDRDWMRAGAWFFGPVAIGMSLILIAWPWISTNPSAWPAAAFGILLLAFSLWIMRNQLKERIITNAAMVALAMPVLLILAIVLALPSIESSLKISPALAAAIRARVNPQMPVYMTGYREPSLVYYVNRPAGQPIQSINGAPEAVASWAAADGPALLVILRDQFETANRVGGPLNLTVLDSQTVLNYSSRGKSQVVLVVGRHLDHSGPVSGSSP